MAFINTTVVLCPFFWVRGNHRSRKHNNVSCPDCRQHVPEVIVSQRNTSYSKQTPSHRPDFHLTTHTSHTRYTRNGDLYPYQECSSTLVGTRCQTCLYPRSAD